MIDAPYEEKLRKYSKGAYSTKKRPRANICFCLCTFDMFRRLPDKVKHFAKNNKYVAMFPLANNLEIHLENCENLKCTKTNYCFISAKQSSIGRTIFSYKGAFFEEP